MASDIGDGDYLGAYRRFFVDFLDKINPDDQLPIKTSGHDVVEAELVGEIVHMTLQYLNQQLCPPTLQCYMVQLVIEEIKSTCRKQPESCGYRQEEKTYEPLKLMQAVTGKINEICQRYLENSRLALLPPPPSTPMPLATSFAIRNSRRKMEDRHVILHDLNTIFNIKDDSIASYYAIFDGHAGYHAAVFCATHLHQYLAESRYYPTDPERALRDAFLTTDSRFIQKSTRESLSGGTTAVCALILNRKLYVAWVGDSQAALAKRGIVTQLVNPHNPDRNDERERVIEMGGMVLHLGIWRVNGNLAVSRAIGDAQYKPYVTGDPEMRCINLDGHEDFLILGCDGLWDCVTENQAAMLVYKEIYRDPYDYKSTSQRLVEYAKHQGSIDNITVIVVFISSPRQIASRSPYGNPLFADVQLKNMEPDNRYLSNENGQYDVNSTFVKQQTTTNNGTSDMTMDDDYDIYDNKSSNGRKRHENGDGIADYNVDDDDDDLGPETDVDAVDDAAEHVTSLADVSRQLFTDKPDPSENYQNDDCIDDDSPPSTHTTKTNQQALIPESDNVGESEDSEDEWNYYRIDPNKEKEAGAAGFSPVPKAENDIVVSSSNVLNEDNTIENKSSSQENVSETSSEADSEKEISKNVLIDTEISAGTKYLTEIEDTETEKVDEQETIKTEEEEEEEEEEEDKEDVDEVEEVRKGTQEESEEDMDFQLNPNAAEFVPVSPTLTMPSTRMELDVPIAGSPLKQTPTMDNIKIPSRREFENEVRNRPHEIEDKSCENGVTPDDNDVAATNLDESEVSSTKAEFGDESSFLTTSEFQRTGISTLDGSFAGSYGEFDDSTIDPMTKSFGPADFISLKDPVDLNAVHDLTDADLMADDDDSTQEVVSDEKIDNPTDDFNLETLKDQTDEQTANLMQSDISPANPENHDILSTENNEDAEMCSNINENTELSSEVVTSTEILRNDPICGENEDIQEKDDIEISQTSAESHVLPETPEETNVTSKLLAMDLEDRGSQDCEFEKCNEKWQNEDETKEKTSSMIDFSTDYLSSSVPQVNLVETFSLPESLPVESAIIEETRDMENLVDAFNDFRAKEDSTLPENTAVPDVPVLHNPLDLNVKSASTVSKDVVLEDDAYSRDYEMKEPDSPGVGVSPLVEEYSKNPFENVEFGASQSCAKILDFDIMNTLDEVEDVKSSIVDNPQECDDSANSSDLKLSESLQEFTGLEQQLNPDRFSNGLEIESSMDTEVEETKNVGTTTQIVPEEIGDKIVETALIHEDVKSIQELESKIEEFKIEEPMIQDTKIEEPTIEDSKIEEPTIEDSKIEEPTIEHSKIEEPTIEHSKIEEATIEHSTIEEPTIEHTKIEEPTIEHLTIEEPTIEDSKVEEPTIEHSKIEESKIEDTKIEEPKIEDSKIDEPKIEETKINEVKEDIVKDTSIVVAAAAAIAAAGTVAAAKTTKTKATPKLAPKTSATTKPAVNKSTPTSPTKSTAAARTSSSTIAKKSAAPARPNKLETTGKSVGAVSGTKTSATAKITMSVPKTTTTRVSSGTTRTKPAISATTKSTSLLDKKPTSNGDVTKSATTTTASNRFSSSSTRVPSKPLVKTAIGAKTTISSTSTTTTTTTSSTRPKTGSSTSTASRITSKTTSGLGATSARPKTAPSIGATSLAGKARLNSAAKSPITEKQIKETANKQISSSRTGTTTTASKISRTSGGATTLAKRAATTKTTTSTSNNSTPQAMPPPIRKPTSANRPAAAPSKNVPTTNGKTTSTKTTSTTITNKTKEVIENGVCTVEANTKILTSTTTSNEEDVPKKDISPIDTPTDNQLIITAD